MPTPRASRSVGVSGRMSKLVPRGPHTMTLSPLFRREKRSVPVPTTRKNSTRICEVTRQMESGLAQVVPSLSCTGRSMMN